jgi:hypothetical protein
MVRAVAKGAGIHNKTVSAKRLRRIKKNNVMQLLVPEEGPVRLTETVKDSSGSVVSSNEFSSNLFTTFKLGSTSNHFLT